MYVGRCNRAFWRCGTSDKKECRVPGGRIIGILLHFPWYRPPVFVPTSKWDLDRRASHSPFRAVQLSYYNCNQRMHTILLKSQYYNTPAATCFGPHWPVVLEYTVHMQSALSDCFVLLCAHWWWASEAETCRS
jgi:hypothetical protein